MKSLVLEENKRGLLDKRVKSSLNVPGPCYARGGSEHRVAKCANKRMSCQKCDKAMMATWSDSEDEHFVYSAKSSDDEKNVVAFVASIKEASSSDDEVLLNYRKEMIY